MKNTLFLGKFDDIPIPSGGSLFINKTVRAIPEWRRPRLFDPLEHSFNPLADLNYKKRCAIVDIFDALFSRGDSTLTKDTGLDYIAEAMEQKVNTFQDLIELPDRRASPGHQWAYSKVRKILRSPVLSKVFCGTPNFSFKKGSVNQARIDPKEITLFDARVLTYFLIAQFDGQVVIQNYRPYAHEMHATLIEEERFMVGVRTLSQLKGLQAMAIQQMEREVKGCNHDDAVTIAKYDCRHPPHTEGYDTFIKRVMA
jgi:hypothetical protein